MLWGTLTQLGSTAAPHFLVDFLMQDLQTV